MRKTHLAKIFFTSLLFCNHSLASDAFTDDDAVTLPTSSSSTAHMTVPKEQTLWQIKGPNGEFVMQVGLTDSKSPEFIIFDQNGFSYCMSPQTFISCYLAQKLSNVRLNQELEMLEATHARAQLRIGSLIEENCSLKNELTQTKESLKNLTQECTDLKQTNAQLNQEKEQLGTSNASLTAANTFLRQNDTNINKELRRATLSAERLIQEKLVLQKQLEQLQTDNASLFATLEAMKYHSTQLINVNEQLATQLHSLSRHQPQFSGEKSSS